MKAWEVYTSYSNNYCDVVFADTRSKAKTKLLESRTKLDSELAHDDSLEWIDIRVKRLPELDGMENDSTMCIAEVLLLKCAWTYMIVPDGKTWNADNFNKEEFEKEWKNEKNSKNLL